MDEDNLLKQAYAKLDNNDFAGAHNDCHSSDSNFGDHLKNR